MPSLLRRIFTDAQEETKKACSGQGQGRCHREIKGKNDCWSMDFVADQLFTGQKLRTLTILDIFTRQNPQIGVGFCYKSIDVVKSLEEAIKLYGKPKAIRVDNGPEFVAKELDLCGLV